MLWMYGLACPAGVVRTNGVKTYWYDPPRATGMRDWIAVVVDGRKAWIVIGLASVGPDADLGTFELDAHAASTPQTAKVPRKASRPRIFLTTATHDAPRGSTIVALLGQPPRSVA